MIDDDDFENIRKLRCCIVVLLLYIFVFPYLVHLSCRGKKVAQLPLLLSSSACDVLFSCGLFHFHFTTVRSTSFHSVVPQGRYERIAVAPRFNLSKQDFIFCRARSREQITRESRKIDEVILVLLRSLSKCADVTTIKKNVEQRTPSPTWRMKRYFDFFSRFALEFLRVFLMMSVLLCWLILALPKKVWLISNLIWFDFQFYWFKA